MTRFLIPDIKVFSLLTREYNCKNKIFNTREEAIKFLQDRSEAGTIYELVATVEVEKVVKVNDAKED